MDRTHDPSRRSWLQSADIPTTDFPIQNLPFGLFRRNGRMTPRVGVAIGDGVLDVRGCQEAGLLSGDAEEAGRACLAPYAGGGVTSLNALMALGPRHWTALRRRLSDLLAQTDGDIDARSRVTPLVVARTDVEMLLPVHIGDYTDFYASLDHATNVGRLFRPDNPLLPNYKWLPIGYHGRASSIIVSGTPVRRPIGQLRGQGTEPPRVGPSQRLDYELEVGCFVGPGNDLGSTIPVADAESHMFGLCLVNDWSARDIQQWEYQPLGPFLAKSFATTISPWIVTLDALEPFRAPALARPAGDPVPLPYLDSPANRERGALAVSLEVGLRTAAMRRRGDEPAWLTRGDLAQMYWTFAQMLAHHASNGCNLRPGDLLASGTVSGPAPGSRGCLLELTGGGTDSIGLPDGETRKFLEDGDEVIMRGFCERPGFARIGFGECRGTIVATTGLGL
jgi:fumarylacetoacetase